jgi:transcriptional regulator with XRE-family HTH domain
MSKAPEQKLLKEFGKRVAAVRKAKSLTQQELSETVGMSVVTIAYIETGHRWVRLGTLHKLAKALHVDVAELFKGL